MHLLQAQPGEIADGVQPVDPGQDPADIIVLSAADSELAMLSEARAALADRLGEAAPSLRLASLDWLRHPYSVDLYLENTALKSSIVIARILGGEAYWPYGLEQFSARIGAAGGLFAALPGDDKPDEALLRASSVTREIWERLWGYLVEGGGDNAVRFLEQSAHVIGHPSCGGEAPAGPTPLLRAGVYWPGSGAAGLEAARAAWNPDQPVAALVFYRALLQGAGLNPVNRLVKALLAEGLNPLPIFVASLKDEVSAATLARLFDAAPPAVVLNATGFAASSGILDGLAERQPTPLDAIGRPVLQVVFSSGAEQAWQDGMAGLSARDIAMYAALPEIDGRLFSRAVSFKGEAYRDAATQCPIASYQARGDRVSFVARLAAAWAKLGATPAAERRIAIVLANYPNKDGRLANGVGLDAPEATAVTLAALAEAGYAIDDAPEDSAALMARILAGPTNALADRAERQSGETLPIEAYRAAYDALPWALRQAIEERWGAPESDPFFEAAPEPGFRLGVHPMGAAVVGVQPARGYNIDPTESYHSPDLVPPHGYLAFYIWLRESFGAQAVIHMGKHGTLEWLPGKALALSEECWPEAVFGATPHLYPFIVNDPGEGTQAKRRAQAVIVDHLTPPMTRADTYGPLKELEALVDEYYEASGLDPRRRDHLAREIVSLMATTGLDADLGLAEDRDEAARLQQLDAHLCELKESQIRDGLHVLGRSPEGRLRDDLIVALARCPRGSEPADASILRALAADLFPDAEFDPLDCDFAAEWAGSKPEVLTGLDDARWRSAGDTVERLELLASRVVAGDAAPGPASAAVASEIAERIAPAVDCCGAREIQGLLTALDGRFLAPGPSGAPTRGRLDVLPTGRNFYSIDSRSAPTPAAWTLGWASATRLIERHLQDEGDWPRAMALTAWGTSNMRTGGDDIAQGMALMGVRPRWDAASRRVVGFEILPLSVLGRPRVDVTLRISGFFRDAFPAQVALFDSAARAVMALEEPEDRNPAAARFGAERGRLIADGASETDAARRAGFRVFGSKPGAYGAGLQAMIDERLWNERADLAEAWLEWGGYAYGGGSDDAASWGAAERPMLETRLGQVDAVVQNQDNREHDLLDSDDYYQFEGGLAATVEHLSGKAPAVWHNDHSRPERPVIRRLDEEIARVVRSRVVNPKWLAGVRRHGYKGAFEIAATVDYLFAFAATTRAVKDHHFDLVYDAVLGDAEIREFIEDANPAALAEIEARLREAIERGLWTPRSNSARASLGGGESEAPR